MAVTDYSSAPGDNGTISGINIAENCPAGNLNNAIRQLMADIAADVPTNSTAVLVSGVQTIAGAKTFSDAATFDGAVSVAGTVTMAGDLNVGDDIVVASDLVVNGNSRCDGELEVVDRLTSTTDFRAAGTAIFSGSATFNGGSQFNNNISSGTPSPTNPGVAINLTTAGGRVAVYADSTAVSSTPLISAHNGAGTNVFLFTNDGNLDVTSLVETSDATLKDDITPMSFGDDVLDLIASSAHNYTMNGGQLEVGTTAQHWVGTQFGPVVNEREDGTLGVRYGPLAVAGVSALAQIIRRLEARVAALESGK